MTAGTDATEALARALYVIKLTGYDEADAFHLEHHLREQGYEVRPIEQPDLRAVRSGAQDPESPAPIDQAAEAADREAAAHSGAKFRPPSAAVAPLDVEALAAALEEADLQVRQQMASGIQPGFRGWQEYAAIIAAAYAAAKEAAK